MRIQLYLSPGVNADQVSEDIRPLIESITGTPCTIKLSGNPYYDTDRYSLVNLTPGMTRQ